jgi:flagellar motor protein MotB
VESIQTYGVLQPLLARPGDQGYEVVAGFKRLEAAREAGLTEVPVRVYRVEDAAIQGLQQASNITGKERTRVTPAAQSDFKPVGSLTGLLEEELNRKPSETPYAFILTIAAVILGLIWGGISLAKRFTGDSDVTDVPAATATPSAGSILFPEDDLPPGDAPLGNANEVQRWRQVLSGVDGVEVRNVSNIPRVVFQEAVFSSLSNIDNDSKPLLRQVAQAIRGEEPAAMLAVIGHTDNDPVRPNNTYRDNKHLGQLRAQAVVDFLASETGIPGHQLRMHSAGEDNPPFSNDNPTDKVRNRTVSIEIISPQ